MNHNISEVIIQQEGDGWTCQEKIFGVPLLKTSHGSRRKTFNSFFNRHPGIKVFHIKIPNPIIKDKVR